MDKKLLLKRLQELFDRPETREGFGSQDDCLDWVSKIAPLVKMVSGEYYAAILHHSQMLNMALTRGTLAAHFREIRSQAQMAIEELRLRIEMDESFPDEVYFPENSYLDIQKMIGRIMQQAEGCICVYDNYMDEKMAEELSSAAASEVRFITQKVKQLFIQRLTAAKQQFPSKKIEAREGGQSHDRFIILDAKDVWTMGSSYNKAGKKSTLIHKIQNAAEKKKIIDDFNQWWSAGKVIG